MIKIEIETDNAAFEDYMFAQSVCDILSKCKTLVNHGTTGCKALFDSNGNRVGFIEITK